VTLAETTRAFVREVCIPAEARELDPALRAELQAAAREAGVFAPHVSAEYGGHGLSIDAWPDVFEAAGYSLLGPVALNIAAPDEGNMHLLGVVATDAQKERYLAPLARGETRSCFAMTEPHPGAGSDPAALAATATRDGEEWVIEGAKRFITGADGAAFTICMARAPQGPTMFLIDAGTPGFEVGRHMPTTDSVFVGGHCEVRFEDCHVGDDAVLGEVGQGYRYAQVRLGPARLTHCMRWLGLAQRALDIALDRAAEREVFGARLEELGLAQGLIADSAIDLEASRALIQRAADALAAGQRAGNETSVAKVFCSEAAYRVVDRAIQLCGGDGVSHDLPLARFLNEVRPFRIYDGPSETHRWAIARRASRRRAAERG
jgi:acyl-CoA dehydrogenase